MKVTIITVVKDREKEIVKTVKSLNEQSYSNSLSWLMVKFGRFKEALGEFNSTPMVISEPDEGIYDALNKVLPC